MKNKSQSIIEYAVLVVILVAAVVTMGVYVERSVNANLKNTEEQINSASWTFRDPINPRRRDPPERPRPPWPRQR